MMGGTDVAMPATNPAQDKDAAPSRNTKPKKRRHQPSQSNNPPPTQLTIRHPRWSYIHLRHLSPHPLDALTSHLHLTTALSQFLGQHGASVPIDLLKLDEGPGEVWIRVPAQDRCAVVAAVGGWVGKAGEGWRVLGWSSWGAGVKGRDGGQELFG